MKFLKIVWFVKWEHFWIQFYCFSKLVVACFCGLKSALSRRILGLCSSWKIYVKILLISYQNFGIFGFIYHVFEIDFPGSTKLSSIAKIPSFIDSYLRHHNFMTWVQTKVLFRGFSKILKNIINACWWKCQWAWWRG